MKLERTTTGLIIHGPDAVIKRKILQYFSLVNPVREFFIYSGNDPNTSPIFGKERDVVYISSGFLNINDNVIKTLPPPSVIKPRTPATITLKMNRQPRSKLQEDAIQMMTQQSPEQHKTTVELKPGVELIPAPAYGDVCEKYPLLNCWDETLMLNVLQHNNEICVSVNATKVEKNIKMAHG